MKFWPNIAALKEKHDSKTGEKIPRNYKKNKSTYYF